MRHRKKQGHMAQTKEQNQFPEIDPKEMKVYDLPGKALKIIIIKMPY